MINFNIEGQPLIILINNASYSYILSSFLYKMSFVMES